PTESIRAGADLVTFSGDKLLGGPQAGIAVGRADLVAAMRRNPLRRALRLDKLAIAGLAATLALLCRPLSALDAMATEAAALVREALGDAFSVEAMESEAEIGSGAQPAFRLPSRAVAVARAGWPPERIAALFRGARPPVVGRIAHGRFLLDLRGVARAEDLVPRASARATEEAP